MKISCSSPWAEMSHSPFSTSKISWKKMFSLFVRFLSIFKARLISQRVRSFFVLFKPPRPPHLKLFGQTATEQLVVLIPRGWWILKGHLHALSLSLSLPVCACLSLLFSLAVIWLETAAEHTQQHFKTECISDVQIGSPFHHLLLLLPLFLSPSHSLPPCVCACVRESLCVFLVFFP